MPLHNPVSEKIESITYKPKLQNSGDLEAGTHTIVPIARPAIGAAQYSSSKTIAAPPDSRLVVERVAARLNVNIAGLGTATHVYCSVRVDVDDVDHELFNEDWTSTGSKLDAVDTHSKAKATIFALLKDGAAHTFYFLFWADVANQATIDVVQLWEAVGQSSTNAFNSPALALLFEGEVSTAVRLMYVGTGTPRIQIGLDANSDQNVSFGVVSGNGSVLRETLVWKNNAFFMNGTVSTDLNYLEQVRLNLRSEQ